MTSPSRSVCIGVMFFVFAMVGTACTHYELSDRQMTFNDALQDADNRQVLLNAVRGSKDYPMYFTAIGTLTSTGVADGSSVGFSIPFGPLNHNVYSATPSIKLQEGLTVATSPLDTQEFYEGFLAPISAQMVAYYQSYGWTDDRSFHAFIQNMKIPVDLFNAMKRQVIDNGGCTAGGSLGGPLARGCITLPDLDSFHSCPELAMLDNPPPPPLAKGQSASTETIDFVNTPTNICQFQKFQYLVELLRKLKFHAAKSKTQSASSQATAAPTPAPTPAAATAAALAVAAAALKSADKSSTPSTSPKADEGQTYGFTLDKIFDECKDKADNKALLMDQGAAAPTAAVPTAPAQRGKKELPPICQALNNTTMVLRSPEGIVFYMGQLIIMEQNKRNGQLCSHEVRSSDDADIPGCIPKIFTSLRYPSSPLFEVHKGEPGSGVALVTVSVDGETYYIKKSEDLYNPSMQFLTLAEQLIALQKKGTALPTTPTVQLINSN